MYVSTLVCPPNKAFLSQYTSCRTPAKASLKQQKSSVMKEVNLQETTPILGMGNTSDSKKNFES